MYQGGFGDRPGEMRDKAHIMGLTERLDFHVLGDAAHVGKRHAHVIDQLLFNELVHVPLAAELFSHRNRNLHVLAQFAIDAGVFGTDQVFGEVGRQRLD